MPTAQDVLNVERSQLGITELPPGSNITPYGAAFGLNGVPWCCEFQWWSFTTAGVPLPKKTAGVYDLMAAFKAAGQFHTSPAVGDLVFWSYGQG